MAERRTRNPLLQDRDTLILHHVARYRMTTPEILHRLHFEGEQRNAVTKITSKLCDGKFLDSQTLYASYTYFTLAQLGAKHVDIRTTKLGPLESHSKYRAYGTLLFCCSERLERKKFTIDEVMKKRPEYIAGKIDSSHYYEDAGEDGFTRWGYIWIDGGGEMRHVVKKFEIDIVEKRRQRSPGLRKQIDAGGFMVAIVTFNEYRRAAIEEALTTIPISSPAKPVSFRVEAYPALAPLLPIY